MPKSLVIVESPAKARTINGYLGPDYVVKASMGHVRDLPAREFGVDIPHGFEPAYEILPARKKAVDQLKAAAKKTGALYLATDLDREGEAIAWHLCHALGVPVEKAFRVVFNQITRSAVRGAFAHPGRIDSAKVNAQQARRILDRIVGYQLSPLLWRLVTKGLSAGRVQSVAVRLVVEREREIAAFKTEEYWKITATLAKAGQARDESRHFTADLLEWRGEKFKCASGAEAEAIAQALRAAPYAVQSVQVVERDEPPPAPFITSTLQQQGSTQLGMNTRRTMRIAQQLYEGLSVGTEGQVGLITYMRTDSVHVAAEALAALREYIGATFGGDYLPEQARSFRQRAGAQAAHEAIRPTDVARTPESVRADLDKEQFRLYDLVWRRFVASQMKPTRYRNTTARIAAGEGIFQAKGRVILFDGFRRVAGFGKEEAQVLPPLAAADPLDLVKLDPSQHFTEPPPRYSEASLVRTLEREGIGRPSTYAPIVATIQDRGYVKLIQRRFHATELAMHVTDLLVEHFSHVMDLGFTRHMEGELDRIEEAGADWVTVLREFYEPFRAALDAAGGLGTDQTCPECGKPLTIKGGRFGSYIGCTGYPACKYRQRIASPENGKTLEEACPQCGKPLALKWSRHGRFIGCSGYPDCDYTRPMNGAVETIDEACPECGKPLAVRSGKRGKFIGCKGYPTCRYTRELPKPGQAAPAAVESQGGAEPPKSPQQVRAEAALQAAEQAVRDKRAAPSPGEQEIAPCEKCGAPMVKRFSRRGPFYGCSTYPKCRNIRPAGEDELASAATGVTCPECGAAMVVRRSRHGPFLGCSQYPQCKGTRRIEAKETQAGPPSERKTGTRKTATKMVRKKPPPRKTGVKCPRAGCDGELVERKGPSGKFFGCSRFPECTYTAQQLPAENAET